MIVESGENKYFYGSSFSGYYVSWKTGQIDLKSFGSNGFHQGIVSESWLIGYKGFTKLYL